MPSPSVDEKGRPLPDRTIVFGVIGERQLQLDLYLPEESAAAVRSGVVCVHGGGWTGGERGQFRWHCRELARCGLVAVTCDYRLADEATWPAQLEDCQRAVRWLRGNAADLRLDAARIGAIGSSAGGHLVACLGVRDTLGDAPSGAHSSRVACVVDIHGVHDLPRMGASQGTARGACEKLAGGPYTERPEVWRDASPIGFVGKDAAPMLFAHDPDDPTVPYDQSTIMAEALMKAHRPVLFLPTPGSRHGYFYNPSNPHTQRVWPSVVAWLDEWLRASP
jgi:acetyl esterase/lipase